jgi:WD40 repeat protein
MVRFLTLIRELSFALSMLISSRCTSRSSRRWITHGYFHVLMTPLYVFGTCPHSQLSPPSSLTPTTSALAQVSSTDPHLVLTGSYDGTVRIFDTRTGECELLMGSTSGSATAGIVPIEQVLIYPSGTVALSAAGSILRIWDIVAGGRCLRAMSNHQKTVTSLAFNANSSRLLTGGLDHMVKVYDISNYNVVHTMRYSAPVICLALSVRRCALALSMMIGFDNMRCSPMKHTSLSACRMERFPFVDDSQKLRKRL